MSDVLISDEIAEKQIDRPPLCLRHYFGEQEVRQSHQTVKKPPGSLRARVVERRGNVIVLEFTAVPDPPVPTVRRSAGFGRFLRNGWDLAMVLLFLGTAVACVVALVR